MLRKVGVNADKLNPLSTQVARRLGNRFEALADSLAAADPAPPGAHHQGQHAEPVDARVLQLRSPQRTVHAHIDVTKGDSGSSNVEEDGEIFTESDTESCGVVERPVRRLRLMWS